MSVCLSLMRFSVAGAAAAPFNVATDGAPSVLLDPQQRAALGLRNGPDSIVDVWTLGGQTYLVFSGAAVVQGRPAGGATFRLPVDLQLEGPTGPLSVLMRAECRDGRPEGGRACTRFDSDYAGAGTVFTCPSGRALYVYHGENRTLPNGMRAGGRNSGWTGIGLAAWNPARAAFDKLGQIAGLNASNAWSGSGPDAVTAQTASGSGNPSAVADPTGHYLYLYFADRTQNPGSTERGLSVARADLRVVCGGISGSARWEMRHDGHFSDPALLPDGTGGAFTPLLAPGDNADEVANVTALPEMRGYVMTSVLRPSSEIVARTSTDGLAWSAPTLLVGRPEPGSPLAYPRIVRMPGARGQTALILLYVKHNGRGWPNASLMRQAVRVTPG